MGIAALISVDAAGADWIHVDVMDGRFVPNISFGPVVIKAVRRATGRPLNVHLMIVEPARGLDPVIEVDGGQNCEYAGEAIASGANASVAGTAIFGARDYAAAIASIGAGRWT